jgi:hypothetical protein
MIGDASDDDDKGPAEIVRFPFSRVTPNRSSDPGDIVYGRFAREIGIPIEQTTGHWCSRCRKIWFGYLLEVTCPTCGSRHG